MKITPINSVPDLIKLLMADDYISQYNPSRPLFYRGHSDKDWALYPSVMRDPLFQERSLILDYKQVFEPHPNYLENMERILATMQPHRIPTRLLDWSISPLQALYFACTDKNEMEKDGELIAINPWLNVGLVNVRF